MKSAILLVILLLATSCSSHIPRWDRSQYHLKTKKYQRIDKGVKIVFGVKGIKSLEWQ